MFLPLEQYGPLYSIINLESEFWPPCKLALTFSRPPCLESSDFFFLSTRSLLGLWLATAAKEMENRRRLEVASALRGFSRCAALPVSLTIVTNLHTGQRILGDGYQREIGAGCDC